LIEGTPQIVKADVEQQPSVEQPTDQQPSSEQPSGEQPTDQQPSSEQPSGEQPTDQHQVQNNLVLSNHHQVKKSTPIFLQ